eukprot:GGOE01027588.1.p1 GENE.GGOE01027588.1~~GGOE01027588.1.p1  ORF type:complete len:567 (+),score=96.12 GGOE01027588.1:34-1734(+)
MANEGFWPCLGMDHKVQKDAPQALFDPLWNSARHPGASLLPVWGPATVAENEMTSFDATACLFANIHAIHAQYAHQLQLQHLALKPNIKAMCTVDKQPQPELVKSNKDIPIQAAEDILADVVDLSASKPFPSSCCVCQMQLKPNDYQTHFLSKEHLGQVFEMEQRAVIVTGVPHETALVVMEVLFQGFVLQPHSVTFIPAKTDLLCEEGLAKVLIQYRPVSDFWHVVLSNPEEAQRAAQIPDLSFGTHRLRVELAIKPQHCITCDVTVQSTLLLEDHRRTHRHQELFRQHAARCGLSLVGLPPTVTLKELHGFLDSCEIIEGGCTTEVVTKKDWTKSLTAHLVFATETDADAAYDLCKAGSPVLGEHVRLLRPSGPKPEEAQAAKLVSEKADEVRHLVTRLLWTNHTTDADALSPFLFSRIYYTFMSARPRILSPLCPRNRFLREFDVLCSRNGTISLHAALVLLEPLEESSNALPESILQWLLERITRYCSNSQEVPITRSVFFQIRDLIHNTHQVWDEVSHCLQATASMPGELATTIVPLSPGPRRRSSASWKPHRASARLGRR